MNSEFDLDSICSAQSARQKKKRYAPRVLNDEQLARLFAESADADKELAEFGMVDYVQGLQREDWEPSSGE